MLPEHQMVQKKFYKLTTKSDLINFTFLDLNHSYLMFDDALKFRLAQIKRNKSNDESYITQHVYVFYCKDRLGCVKYIATVKEYEDDLLTIEFYPKVRALEKYKILTFQYRFPSVGATILRIMREVQEKLGIRAFGILAASLIDEVNNEANKRYTTYVNILTRKSDNKKYEVLGVPDNSFIFVIPLVKLNNKDQIILRYEKIFKETQ